jgi:hypothetical protein
MVELIGAPLWFRVSNVSKRTRAGHEVIHRIEWSARADR